ncbi:DJ-1/PfpI family protein [Fusobacterium sp.]|uniref:DJ-1/PfpI family protein n=1 Tax=Fusobacterium sp. TaxID=68766 RepID=UPI00396C4B5E
MKNILLLISQGSELLEIAPFTDVFGWNNILSKDKICIKTCSFHSKISATWNVEITPEINLAEKTVDLDSFDAIVIPGGFGYRGFFNDMKLPQFIDIIQHFNKKHKTIAGICTGAITLGEAGILTGKKATTYLYDNDRYHKQLKFYGAVPVKENIVIDENIITVSGPKNAIDCAFLLLEILTSKNNADIVKYNMGF